MSVQTPREDNLLDLLLRTESPGRPDAATSHQAASNNQTTNLLERLCSPGPSRVTTEHQATPCASTPSSPERSTSTPNSSQQPATTSKGPHSPRPSLLSLIQEQIQTSRDCHFCGTGYDSTGRNLAALMTSVATLEQQVRELKRASKDRMPLQQQQHIEQEMTTIVGETARACRARMLEYDQKLLALDRRRLDFRRQLGDLERNLRDMYVSLYGTDRALAGIFDSLKGHGQLWETGSDE